MALSKADCKTLVPGPVLGILGVARMSWALLLCWFWDSGLVFNSPSTSTKAKQLPLTLELC